MSPAPKRAEDPDLDMLWSWDTSNPTMAADRGGWLNYHTTENRYYVWDETSWKKIALTPVPNSELADMAAATVKGRASGAGTGAPADLVKADLHTIIAASATQAADTIPITGSAAAGGKLDPANWIKPNVTPGERGILYTKNDGTVVWQPVSTAVANLECIFKATSQELAYTRFSGDAFPAAPVDGQRCYRTDMKCWFYYDSAAAGWLSSHISELDFGAGTTDMAATQYLRLADQNGSPQFTDTYGHCIGVACKVVGISLCMTDSGTCTIQVFDDGAGVTGATLSLSSQTAKADELLMSNTIAASSILGVKVTSGTVEGSARGKVRLRRFET